MAKKKKSEPKLLTREKVLAWLGADEKDEIAGYISGILNDLKKENLSLIAINLYDEILTYDYDEESTVLTQEKVFAWIGDDDKSDMAWYITDILNNIKNEGLSAKGVELFNEIYDYGE